MTTPYLRAWMLVALSVIRCRYYLLKIKILFIGSRGVERNGGNEPEAPSLHSFRCEPPVIKECGHALLCVLCMILICETT